MISQAEYEARWTGLQHVMAAAGLDGMVAASPPALQYLAGYRPPLIVSSARPWLCIVPTDGLPSLGVAALAHNDAVSESAISRVFEWASPASDEGLAELLAELDRLPRRHGRIGLELGAHTRLGFPASYLNALAGAGHVLVDIGPLLWDARLVKSAAEIALMRQAAHAGGHAFAEAAKSLAANDLSERHLDAIVRGAALSGGAEEVGYVAVGSGPGGYDSLVRRAGERRIGQGDVVGIDLGASVEGYWCDFNRNMAVGSANDPAFDLARRAADAVWRAAHGAIRTVARAGITAGALWLAMARILEDRGFPVQPTGRMGHGVGLEFTEWPSIAPGDDTILRAGMVLAIEPSVGFANPASPTGFSVMTYEDMVVVREDGCEYLTTPAPGGLSF